MKTTFEDLQAKAANREQITLTKGWEYNITAAAECDGQCGTPKCVGHLDLTDVYGCGTKLNLFVSANGTYH